MVLHIVLENILVKPVREFGGKTSETNDVRYVCRNKIENLCFHQDHAYSSVEDLVKRAEADKALKDESIHVANDG